MSWKVLATFATVSLVFVVTGQIKLALGVGLIDVVLKLVLYYIHERSWADISWGLSVTPPTGKHYKKTFQHRCHLDDCGKPKNWFYASLEKVSGFERQILNSFAGKKK